jgi:hypothetical protein
MKRVRVEKNVAIYECLECVPDHAKPHGVTPGGMIEYLD